ncbi:lytic transglycosylase domain-containing protein [Salsuginibacillus kocurii]|uniref:lytic transglycosylase domain-containing protein n=1 Tax=Salsuginibacillus kocurii TaxID=427078 RepID=UPI0003625A3F|nr:lytic transglycosylase domain-containing protein [Salsuginibacillus kocurii]
MNNHKTTKANQTFLFSTILRSESGSYRALPVVIVSTLVFVAFVLISNSFLTEGDPSYVGEDDVEDSPGEVPEEYMDVYLEAAETYQVDWSILAAIHRVETSFSEADPMVSEVGAVGHMQFMPCTWTGWGHPSCDDVGKGEIPEETKRDPDAIAMYGGYGVDASGDGQANPWNIEDAVHSAARYLQANGASEGAVEEAVFAYNRADWYVEDVLTYAESYANEASSSPTASETATIFED